MEKLDYHFGKLPMPRESAAALHSARAPMIDGQRHCWQFILMTVLHSACSLDSRYQRVDWGSNVCWIDIDLPDVIALRRRMLPTSLPRKDYQLIDADITEGTWEEAILTDRPVLIVIEVLLSYLQSEDGRTLLRRWAQSFKEGELLFECMVAADLSATQRHHTAVSSTGNVIKWTIGDLEDTKKIRPKLKLLEAARLLEVPGFRKFLS